MDGKKRAEVISGLSDLTDKAREIEKEIDYLLSRHDLHQDKTLAQYPIWSNAGKLSASLQKATDALKSEGVEYVKACITEWYRFHIELDDVEEPADPTFESVVFKGDNTWEIIMTTPTDGRQKAILHSDGASWDQVYSVDPA